MNTPKHNGFGPYKERTKQKPQFTKWDYSKSYKNVIKIHQNII